MTYRMLTVVGALAVGLGLTSAASAQNMQPGMGGMQQGGQMQQGGMSRGGMQKGMRSKKMMMKKKKMMRRGRM